MTQGTVFPSGCLSVSDGGYSTDTVGGTGWRARCFSFDAKRANSVYKSNYNNVTPQSQKTNFVIRY